MVEDDELPIILFQPIIPAAYSNNLTAYMTQKSMRRCYVIQPNPALSILTTAFVNF